MKKAQEGTPLVTYDDFICLALLATNGNMTKMSLFVGNLSEREQQTLGELLAKLDQFHNPQFLHDKHMPLSELYEKLVGAERPVITSD